MQRMSTGSASARWNLCKSSCELSPCWYTVETVEYLLQSSSSPYCVAVPADCWRGHGTSPAWYNVYHHHLQFHCSCTNIQTLQPFVTWSLTPTVPSLLLLSVLIFSVSSISVWGGDFYLFLEFKQKAAPFHNLKFNNSHLYLFLSKDKLITLNLNKNFSTTRFSLVI